MGTNHKTLHKLLKMPSSSWSTGFSDKRLDIIKQAIEFKKGDDLENQFNTEIYSYDEYKVSFAKPGKEVYREKRPNKNDMRPRLSFKGEFLDDKASFRDIYMVLFSIKSMNETALDTLGCLMIRNAFLLDHKQNEQGEWHYSPNETLLASLEKHIPKAYNVPIRVFLHFLEGLAWQEDVKYYTLNKEVKGKIGRQNSLFTCANIVAYLLDRLEVPDLFYKLMTGRGIASLSQKEIKTLFPYLDPKTTF